MLTPLPINNLSLLESSRMTPIQERMYSIHEFLPISYLNNNSNNTLPLLTKTSTKLIWNLITKHFSRQIIWTNHNNTSNIMKINID